MTEDPPTYTLTLLPGDESSYWELAGPGAWGLGPQGTVVGMSSATNLHAFKFFGGVMHDLGTLPDDAESQATDVNGSGHVVGSSGASWRPFFYNGTSMQELPQFIENTGGAANAVNNDDLAVGFSYDENNAMRPVAWENGQVRDLGTLPSEYPGGQALDVNELGEIVGYSITDLDGRTDRAVIWTGSAMDDLTHWPGALDTWATAINDRSHIVGWAQHFGAGPYLVREALVWEGGPPRELPPLPDMINAEAAGIDNCGRVVGKSSPAYVGVDPVAVIWIDGIPSNLNDLVDPDAEYTLRAAHAINDAGAIVGIAESDNAPGTFRAYKLTPTQPEGDCDLLERFAPELRFDLEDNYRPVSAATITDNFTEEYTNALKRPSPLLFPVTLAQSDPEDEFDTIPTLKLGYLGPHYPDDTEPDVNDFLDEAGDEQNEFLLDAQRMQALPQYAKRVYGRVIQRSGETLLQYWFWYYYNAKTFYTVGGHEGDWEMIQLHLNSDETLVGATYAQHEHGEYCAANNIELSSLGRPVVYVAVGSHAGYFWPGQHEVPHWSPPEEHDEAYGDAPDSMVPNVVPVTSPPAWMRWPGRFGTSSGSGPLASSPHGPAFQDKWSDPDEFTQTALACTDPPSAPSPIQSNARLHTTDAKATLRPPPTPTIKARIVGSKVAITYTASPSSGHAKPWLLVTTIDNRQDRYTPTTLMTLIKGRSRFRVLQPIGLARRPLTVYASVKARDGARSTRVAVRVK